MPTHQPAVKLWVCTVYSQAQISYAVSVLALQTRLQKIAVLLIPVRFPIRTVFLKSESQQSLNMFGVYHPIM